ncbi:MAG: hypothetical protein H7178_10995 [Chitinophagaceae bacterium]|nr:hypothetical protein [Chitinophagaceae bacterium]
MSDLRIVASIEANTGDTTKKIDETKKSVKELGGGFDELKSKIKDHIESTKNALKANEDGFKGVLSIIKGGVVGAFNALKAALMSNPFMLISEILIIVISKFEGLKDALVNLVPGLGFIIKVLGKIKDAFTDFIGITSDATRATAKFIEETEKALKAGERFLDLNGDKYDEFTQRKIKANIEYQKHQIEFSKDEKLSQKEKDEFIKQASDKRDREIDAATKGREDRNKKETDKSNEEAKRKGEKEQSEIDKRNARNKAANDKELAEENRFQHLKNKLIGEANLAAIKDELLLSKQRVFNKQRAELKSVEDLKVSEDKKAELRILINKSAQEEIDKLYYAKRLKEKEAADKEYKEWKKKFDEDNVKKKKAVDDYYNNLISSKLKSIEELNAIDLRLSKPQEQYEQQLFDLKAKYEKELKIIGDNEELKARLEAEYAETVTDLKTQHLNKQLDETKNIGGKITEVIGQQTEAGKGFGIATALINTYQGATDALRAKSTLPSPFDVIAKVANVSAVIAMGFKAAKAITTIPVPGGGGGSTGSLSMPAPLAPTPLQTSTSLNQSSINAVGNAGQGGVNRAFVLDSDIKNADERQRSLARAARLG